ncbi:MAG: flavodoxin family protein [Spirochaetaceae bacterium]|jgi:multimeric flavodoxin WrbA|nr:flavodoxin family protein [Spirochaetaceae bacterium]
MKVIAFNGSPHNEGVIYTGILAIAGELKKAGIDAEIVHVGDKAIHGCIGCGSCRKHGLCALKDDIVNECVEKTRAADGVILGSPVYYGGIAGAFKCFLDRMFYTGVNLEYKAGTVVASCRRSGGIATFQQLCNYLNLAGAVITPTVYWGVIHGNNANEVKEDGEGLYTMEAAGRNMAWLMKTLEAGKNSAAKPVHGARIRTNFVR